MATRVLDLCAGSGAIGCAVLARAFGARVSFGEIDPKHEATILKNIRENHLDASPHSAKASRDKRADIRIGDLFEPFENERFDLIAINPPYIPSGRELDTSVTDYEPAGALYSGDDGLDLIRRIACELPRHLAQGGSAWIEVDSAHASAARDLFSDQGFTPEIMNDHYGVPRIIRI